MTSKGKLVSLGHRPGSPETLHLIAECRALTHRFLSEAIQELFQKNDDTLFGFAEKASGEEANSRYFDAMRALRLKKEEIVRGFMERVGHGFTRLERPESAGGEPAARPGEVTLSLLDDAELEESLAIQSMAEKVENHCAEELTPLRHRLGSLIGGAPLEGREDPNGPARLAEAYRESLRVLDKTDIEVRLVLYKLFDKVVLGHVDELYSDLNALLAKNGVMPEFKLRPRPERPRPTREKREREEDDDGTAQAATAELLPLLRNLLTQQRGGSGTGGGVAGGGAAPEESGPPIDPREVMTALTSLQRQLKSLQIDTSGPVSADTVRAALKSGSGGAISRQDSDVIDLISMLFESILDDRGVPDSVRVLLARLQIPMLKVALVDRTFFSKPKHPARRLLNMLAKAGIGLDDSSPENSPRLVEIERIVTTILESLTDDLGVFEQLADGFETFLAQQTERELVAARKQTIGVRAREAKEQIRMAVHRKLDEFFAAQPVPAPVDELLRGPWTEVLVETRLRSDHAIWATRTQLIRDVIVSVTPKKSREERLGVPPVIARILPGLRSGLSAIGWSPERIDAVMAMLEPYHLAVVHGKPLPTDVPSLQAGGGGGMDGLSEEMRAHMAMIAETEALHAQVREVEHRPAPVEEEIVLSDPGSGFSGAAARAVAAEESHAHDEYLHRARGYEVGSWFNFIGPDGRGKRAKLTWKSNLLDECIFLDWKMRMVADLNMAQFAGRLYDGTVTELQDTPLFDRAMDALMMRLRKQPA